MSNKLLFTGLADLTNRVADNRVTSGGSQQSSVFLGQVLDVCLDSSSPLYEDATSIGLIRVRPLLTRPALSPLFEDEINSTAQPIDRSSCKYPLPGEQVLLYLAWGDKVVAGNDPDTGKTARALFYGNVVCSHRNTTYNVDPFLATSVHEISAAGSVSETEATQRFEKRLVDPDSYKSSANQVKLFKQLQPFEGDYLIQGRFGNTIRMGSTSTTNDAPWANGVSGDPITIIRVDREIAEDTSQLHTVEDINVDDSSIWLGSSQAVELQLSCTNSMKSWQATFGLQPSGQGAIDSVTNLT